MSSPSVASTGRLARDTVFGHTTGRRSVVFRPNSWWRPTGREVPSRAIAAIHYEVLGNLPAGLILIVSGVVAGAVGGLAPLWLMPAFGAIGIGVGLVVGRPRIRLHTTAGATLTATGPPWQRAEADRFVGQVLEELRCEGRLATKVWDGAGRT